MKRDVDPISEELLLPGDLKRRLSFGRQLERDDGVAILAIAEQLDAQHFTLPLVLVEKTVFKTRICREVRNRSELMWVGQTGNSTKIIINNNNNNNNNAETRSPVDLAGKFLTHIPQWDFCRASVDADVVGESLEVEVTLSDWWAFGKLLLESLTSTGWVGWISWAFAAH